MYVNDTANVEKVKQQLIDRANRLRKEYHITLIEITMAYYGCERYKAKSRSSNLSRVLTQHGPTTLETAQNINDAIDKVLKDREIELQKLRDKYGLE